MDLRHIDTKARQFSPIDDPFKGPYSEALEADVQEVDTNPEEFSPQHLARRVVDLIVEGKNPETAATEVGLPPSILATNAMQNRIKELLASAYLPAEIQRAVLRAGRFETFVTMQDQGIKEKDVAKLKVALEASKQIGMDPEIGLNQPPQQVVNIEIGGLRELLENTPPLEGFDAPRLEKIEWHDEEK